MDKSTHANHRQRMRERFIKEKGFDSFSDHQVLEMLLFLCLPRCDTNEIAHKLIDRFGSFSAVLERSLEDLQEIDGIGESAAVSIRMITELCRRYYLDRNESRPILDTPEKVESYIRPHYIGASDELAYCICLDAEDRVVGCDLLSRGDEGATYISVRKVVETALRYHATSVILSHNHPSGMALPSGDDVETTREVQDGLKTIGVSLDDHFILSPTDWFSMRQCRYL